MPAVLLEEVRHGDGHAAGVFPHPGVAGQHPGPPHPRHLLPAARHHRRPLRLHLRLSLQLRPLQRDRAGAGLEDTVRAAAARQPRPAARPGPAARQQDQGDDHDPADHAVPGPGGAAPQQRQSGQLPGRVPARGSRLLPRLHRARRLDRGAQGVRGARCSATQVHSSNIAGQDRSVKNQIKFHSSSLFLATDVYVPPSLERPAEGVAVARWAEQRSRRRRPEFWVAGNDIEVEGVWQWAGRAGAALPNTGWLEEPYDSYEENCLVGVCTGKCNCSSTDFTVQVWSLTSWHASSCCNNLRYICTT